MEAGREEKVIRNVSNVRTLSGKRGQLTRQETERIVRLDGAGVAVFMENTFGQTRKHLDQRVSVVVVVELRVSGREANVAVSLDLFAFYKLHQRASNLPQPVETQIEELTLQEDVLKTKSSG